MSEIENKAEETPVDTGKDRETNQWAMFLHFSILAGWVVPLGGLIEIGRAHV